MSGFVKTLFDQGTPVPLRPLSRWSIHGCQKLEVRICGFERGPVAAGAGGNDYISGRGGNALGSRSPRQVAGHPPDLFVDGKLGEGAGKIPQNLLFLLPGGTIPQFELHQWAPTGLPRGQRRFDASANRGVAARTEHVYPRRGIDEDQQLSLAAARPEALAV